MSSTDETAGGTAGSGETGREPGPIDSCGSDTPRRADGPARRVHCCLTRRPRYYPSVDVMFVTKKADGRTRLEARDLKGRPCRSLHGVRGRMSRPARARGGRPAAATPSSRHLGRG